MLSNRSYLLRAFYQWIIDSACTPILVIDAKNPRCKIPMDYAENGEIVFNVSPTAVRDLKIANDLLEFKASFSGVIHLISAPIKAILSIYAEENGEGIFFDAEEDDVDESISLSGNVENIVTERSSKHEPSIKAMKSKPTLKLVE